MYLFMKYTLQVKLSNKALTAPENSMRNKILTNPVIDKICKETTEFQSSQRASISRRYPSLDWRNFFFFFLVKKRLYRHPSKNRNNASVSPSPSWGSKVELISHNISKQTLLASLTHTPVFN